MIITIGKTQLNQTVKHQLRNIFLCKPKELSLLTKAIPDVLPLVETCFAANNNEYYRNAQGSVIFNPFHSGQYSIFLYFLSRLVWQKYQDSVLADKIYCLNKMLGSLDLYYQVQLPAIFFLDHPVGSVIGRAKFSNYFVFSQNCTVGGNNDAYPVFGEYVHLFAHSMVIGASTVGNNVFISAGSLVKDENIPDNSIVFGQSPNLIIKQKPSAYFHSKSPFFVHHKTGIK